MTLTDGSGGITKRYQRLLQVAEACQIEPLDLLSYGIDGEMPVGILAYSADASVLPDSAIVFESDKGDEIDGTTPDWIILLMPKTLKAIASDGGVESGRGYRWRTGEWEMVSVEGKPKIALSDLVIPRGAVQELEKKTVQTTGGGQSETDVLPKEVVSPPDDTLTKKQRSTLLKQIGGLAFLLSKVGHNFVWGEKPNASAMVKNIHQELAKYNKASKPLDLSGLGDSSLGGHISEGLKLIGFEPD